MKMREPDLFGLGRPGSWLWMTALLCLQKRLVLTTALNDRYVEGSATVS